MPLKKLAHTRRESRNLKLNQSFEAENKTPNPLTYSTSNYPSSTRASSRPHSNKSTSKTRSSTNTGKVREYLVSLAKKNLVRLGEKLEGVSMALVEQRVVQEFKHVEAKVVERIAMLLQSMTAAVKRELLNFINLKIKLAMAKSGIIPEGKKQLLVT